MRTCVYGLAMWLLCTEAFAQQTAVVTESASVYLTADASRTPLRVAAKGTRFGVLQDRGEWLQVEFNDPQHGRRVGWVLRTSVVVRNETLTPMDLSIPPPGDAAAPAQNATGAQPRASFAYPGRETAIAWSAATSSNATFGPSTNIPLGWSVSQAMNVSPAIGLAIEASGNYKRDLLGVRDWNFQEHAIGGGPRFALRQTPSATLYGQVLAGYVWMRATSAFSSATVRNEFFIQPGVGIDVGRGRVALRLQGDWRRWFETNTGQSPREVRFSVGAVMYSGMRRQ